MRRETAGQKLLFVFQVPNRNKFAKFQFTHIAYRYVAHVALVELHIVSGVFCDEIAHFEVDGTVKFN